MAARENEREPQADFCTRTEENGFKNAALNFAGDLAGGDDGAFLKRCRPVCFRREFHS
jgi:hypothetical protein